MRAPLRYHAAPPMQNTPGEEPRVVTDTVGNWERGFCTPRLTDLLGALADILECDVQDLFESEQINA